MPSSPASNSVFDRVLAALPGWLLLGAGLALMAAVVLTPAWLDWHKLAWQREVVEAQSEHLAAQAARYERFHVALRRDDPVVLERLAYVELGLKPADKTPLPGAPLTPGLEEGGSTARHHFAGYRLSNGLSDDATPRRPTVVPPTATVGSVDHWLARPLPKVGQELPVYQPPRSRLTRLATGHSRFAMLAAGLACIVAGLWPGMWGNGLAGSG